MNRNDFRAAYDFLIQIYRDNAYLHIVMKENSNKRVKKLVFGVLDKHYELNYQLNKLVNGKIKNNVRPLLLIALYSLKFLETPQNVVINETTETLDSLGKSALKGFVCAVINRAAHTEFTLPSKSDKNYYEVKYNLPSWLIGMYRKDYPDTYESIINAEEFHYSHVRLAPGTTENDILNADKGAIKTRYGYFVKNNKDIELLSCMGKITFMSYGSCFVADCVGAKKGMRILDSCAAPGGKAVLMAQTGAEVVACDIHEHRVELIRSYADRMKVGMETYKQDATSTVYKWQNSFDAVLADVPCSGLGVVGKKRDIVFNRTYDDIKRLSEIQLKILNNVSKYVKDGGVLVYATCTIFNMENGAVVDAFLEKHDEFTLEKIDCDVENKGKIQLLPDGKGTEGFYICRMRKRA